MRHGTMTGCNHPMSIQGRRRRRRVDVVDARKKRRLWIRVMWRGKNGGVCPAKAGFPLRFNTKANRYSWPQFLHFISSGQNRGADRPRIECGAGCIEITVDHLFDIWPSEALLPWETVIVFLHKGFKIILHAVIIIRILRVAWLVKGCGHWHAFPAS